MSKDSSYKQNLGILIPKSNKLKAVVLVISTIILFFIGQLVGVLLVFFALTIGGFSSDQIQTMLSDNIYVQFLSILAIEAITIALIAYVLKLRGKLLWPSVALDSKPKLKSVGIAAIAYGLYFLVFVITATLVSWLMPSVDVNQSQQLGFESPVGFELVLTYCSLVILPAFAEEVLFRGFLFQRLRAFIDIRAAAVITSLVFACAHLEFFGGGPLNYIAAIDTFIFSFFLIGLLVKTKSLWASIFLHAIKNSIAFVVLFII